MSKGKGLQINLKSTFANNPLKTFKLLRFLKLFNTILHQVNLKSVQKCFARAKKDQENLVLSES
ncbi:hypothetical protein ACRCJN_06245 [Aerococcus urinaeequi]|uniref:hypothetical protein n=1 Tax=Aerococcus urinaeequi TaxID=51665 RepID=UPI003D6B7D59